MAAKRLRGDCFIVLGYSIDPLTAELYREVTIPEPARRRGARRGTPDAE